MKRKKQLPAERIKKVFPFDEALFSPPQIKDIPFNQLVELLLGEEGKRRLRLRQMPNDQLFTLYDSELVLHNQAKHSLYEARRMLKHFRQFLRGAKPTPEQGKLFLGLYSERSPATLPRYAQQIKSFFDWYGEKLGVYIKVPRVLHPYVPEKDIQALFAAIESRPSHKKKISRDSLLIELALNTGLRRAELSNLKIRDIYLEQGMLLVRNGKGGKDAVVPLNNGIKEKLKNYISPKMSPDQNLFDLKPASISLKIKWFADKAGVKIHTHTLRHVFCTRLIESGANLEAVRRLMRHERLDTTQRYINLSDEALKETIALLDNYNNK